MRCTEGWLAGIFLYYLTIFPFPLSHLQCLILYQFLKSRIHRSIPSMAPLPSVLELLWATRYQCLTLLVGLLLFQQWISWRRLSQFRGPFWASFTNLWMANSIAQRRAHLDLFEVSQEYGSVSTSLQSITVSCWYEWRRTGSDWTEHFTHQWPRISTAHELCKVWVYQGRLVCWSETGDWSW